MIYVSVTVLFLSLAFRQSYAREQSVHRFNESWSAERANTDYRVRDSIGTSLRLNRMGPLQRGQVVSTLRSGPASDVLRQSLQNASRHCDFNRTFGCDISYGGGGNVGEVQYSFRDDSINQRGHSSQVMVACKCIGRECREAVLLQPFNVVDDENSSDVLYQSCLYQREKKSGKLSECHTELLLLTARRRHTFEEVSGDISVAYLQYSSAPWVYNVSNSGWIAYGQRGWMRNIRESDFLRKSTVNLTEVAEEIENAEGEAKDDFFYFAFRNSDSSEVEYVKDEDPAEGRNCFEIYENAMNSGAFLGTQSDEIAIGRSFSTHFEQRPALLSPTELALASSAAALGTYAVWMTHLKFVKNEVRGIWRMAGVLTAQMFLYVLESLPLLLGVISEFDARAFQTQFAHVDGTLAVSQDMTSASERTAIGSIYVATALVGQVRYQRTNSWFVLLLFLLFTISTLAGVVATFLKWLTFRRMESSEADVGSQFVNQGNVGEEKLKVVDGGKNREESEYSFDSLSKASEHLMFL